MAKVKVYNLEGKTAGDMELSDEVFGVKIKPELVAEALRIQELNARQVLAHTKTRGEVRGGGRKPWRQKGTGRARHGSRRSPIWVGGGITFGPRNTRVFAAKINKKVRRKAIQMVLTDRVTNDKFVILTNIALPDAKTKMLSDWLNKLPSKNSSTLLIVDPKNTAVRLAAKNLQNVTTIAPNSMNVRDLLRHEYLIAAKDSIGVITKTYSA